MIRICTHLLHLRHVVLWKIREMASGESQKCTIVVRDSHHVSARKGGNITPISIIATGYIHSH